MPPHSAFLSQLYRLTSPPPGDSELLRRWVEHRDEDAFTALVSRHGRMVHGVCRRVLGNSHDAEDAFQAVFLTLARKAAALRHPEALPGWLHGVAVRLACKARTAAVRRRCGNQGASAGEPRDPHPDPLDALSARELLGLIDREVARLPEKYRLPLVLCDLEGRTQTEAAQLLGWTLGSFRGRLLRGRERLRTRLARRGIAPMVLASACVQGTTDAAVLTASVSRLAVRFLSCPESVPISPSVAALVREGIRGMMLTQLKLASLVLLAACTLITGAGLLAWSTSTPQPADQRAEDKPPLAPVSVKPQVRRDQAGDPLPEEAISRLGTIRFRHGGLIFSLAFTPDGKTLVSEGVDGLRIWETATGKQIRRVGDGSVGSAALDISPDGKLAAMLLPAKESVGLMEVATGQIVRRFGNRQVHALGFSPDGKLLATLGFHSEIDLWDPATGKALGTLKGHQDEVCSAVFSGDGKTLVSAGDDRTIRFWDITTGKERQQIQTETGVGKLALSPDGRILASLGHIKHKVPPNGVSRTGQAVIRLWDTHTGKELHRITIPAVEVRPGITEGFSMLLFTPDGKSLVTSGRDGVVRIWETATGKEVRQFSGFGGAPFSFSLHPDGKILAAVDGGSTIRLLRLDTGMDPLALDGHRAGVFSVFLAPDGQTAATASGDGLLRLWDTRTGARRRDIVKGSRFLLKILSGGKTYLRSGDDKKLRLCELDTGKEIRILQGWNGRPYSFALSPDGRILAQVDADYKYVQLIDPATGELLHTLTEFNQPYMGFTFAPDSRSLFLWSADKTVTVWDTATGEKQRQLPGPASKEKESWKPPGVAGVAGYSVFMATLSPDGKLLAFGLQSTGHDPGILPIVDTASGKEVRCFTTGKDGVSALEFSPDGKSLAWGGWREGMVYLGEIATGRERHRLTGHKGRIFSLAFSADGQTLISGSEDTTALIWDLTGRLTTGTNFGKALPAEELETHWKSLAGEDAAAAYRAIQMLAADPARSIPFLRTRLHPVAPVDEKRVQQWIADLDSDQFAVRERATSELKKAGAAARDAMRKALAEKPVLEKRRRLEPLIEMQEREVWSPSPDKLRSRRAIEVLERVGTSEAKDVLTMLASGAPGAWQTLDAKAALQRLAQRAIR